LLARDFSGIRRDNGADKNAHERDCDDDGNEDGGDDNGRETGRVVQDHRGRLSFTCNEAWRVAADA
jgi:hypothetical protein